MACDEGLVQRIRDALAADSSLGEKRMFGGVCFMYRGHMLVGVSGSDLMARVGEAAHDQALQSPGARPMDFTGRPMKGYVFVDAAAIAEDAALQQWLDRARAFVASLPPKPPAPAKAAVRGSARAHPGRVRHHK